MVCQASIDGQEPGTRKGCHYISLHQIKVEKAISVNLSVEERAAPPTGDHKGPPHRSHPPSPLRTIRNLRL
jgi:hypothetical protein